MVALGIDACHGHVSGVLMRGGGLAAAVEGERFHQFKDWAWLPREAIRTCLERMTHS